MDAVGVVLCRMKNKLEDVVRKINRLLFHINKCLNAQQQNRWTQSDRTKGVVCAWLLVLGGSISLTSAFGTCWHVR